MIELIRGELLSKDPSYVVIDAGGIGFGLVVSLTTYDSLPPSGGQCRLFVHEQVREDAYTLYGFATDAERNLFRLLTGVSGVGPKLAMGVLSGMGIRDLLSSIANRDIRRLSGISGIGKRTAERIAVELADKVNPFEAYAGGPCAGAPAGAAARDAVLALVALGHSQEGAAEAVRRVMESEDAPSSTGDIVRRVLASGGR